jgi:hypothetical protein
MRVARGAVRLGLAGLIGLAAASTPALPQSAPALPVDEDARLALIDYCVLEVNRMAGQYDNFADRCRCATKAMMATMSETDMQAVAKWRKPTTALKPRWTAAWASCG